MNKPLSKKNFENGGKPPSSATDQKTVQTHQPIDAAYLKKPAHLRTRKERFDAGKALRVLCPRESQSEFNPVPDRPDPISLLI